MSSSAKRVEQILDGLARYEDGDYDPDSVLFFAYEQRGTLFTYRPITVKEYVEQRLDQIIDEIERGYP